MVLSHIVIGQEHLGFVGESRFRLEKDMSLSFTIDRYIIRQIKFTLRNDGAFTTNIFIAPATK